MSFVPNESQQLSLFDKLAFLSKRKQQMLEKSWAQSFSDHIFTRINEHIFAPLYSEKTNSRPNARIIRGEYYGVGTGLKGFIYQRSLPLPVCFDIRSPAIDIHAVCLTCIPCAVNYHLSVA